MSFVIQVYNKTYWFSEIRAKMPTSHAEADEYMTEQVRISRRLNERLFMGGHLRWVEIDDRTGDVVSYGPWTPPRPSGREEIAKWGR